MVDLELLFLSLIQTASVLGLLASLGLHENLNLVLFDVGRTYRLYNTIALITAAVNILQISSWQPNIYETQAIK